jgi:GT2 family glycosyltransferase
MRASVPISVVIPTWRGAAWLPRCLEALSRQTCRPCEVVLVQNGGPAPEISPPPELPLHLHQNPTNRGFAAAVNQVIWMTRALYVAVLNDDAFPEPGWLEALLKVMEADPEIGACAGLMVFDHRPEIVQSAGIAIDRAAIAWDRLRGYPVAHAQAPAEVFGASAGAAPYRRAMLEALGGFDERFFAYLEDVDLAWRAQIAGWRCVYVPSARVRHLTSASLGEGAPLHRFLLGRNKVWLVAKNAPAADLPLIWLYDLLGVAYALLRRGNRWALRGRLAGLRGIRPFLAERRPGSPRVVAPLVPPWQVPRRWAYP